MVLWVLYTPFAAFVNEFQFHIDRVLEIAYNVCKVILLYTDGIGADIMSKDFNRAVLLDFYGDVLTEKQRDVVDLYYNEDMSLGEIAEHSGITRQGVRDSIKRAEMIMMELEEKLGFVARYNSFLEKVEQIKKSVQVIDIQNDKYFYSPQIKKCSKEILETVDDLLKLQL